MTISRMILAFCLIYTFQAEAQMRTLRNRGNTPLKVQTKKPEEAPKESAPPPNPVKVSYSVEYQGNQLGKRQDQTLSDLDTGSFESAKAEHSFKFGYQFHSNFTAGAQIRAVSSTVGQEAMTYKNFRFWFNFGSLIDNSVFTMLQLLDVELPTTQGSKDKFLIGAANIKNLFIIKTPLRNVSFSVLTFIRPSFFEQVTEDTSDLYYLLAPTIAVDLTDSLQIQAEGSFDGSHSVNRSSFELSDADPNSVTIGPVWSVNSHIQINPAIRFFTEQFGFDTSVLFIGASISL